MGQLNKEEIKTLLMIKYGYDFHSDFWTDEIKVMLDEICDTSIELHGIKTQHINDRLKEKEVEIAELTKRLENKKDECNEYAANCNKYHDLYLSKDGKNQQLQSTISEQKERIREWISVEDRLPLATETGNWDGKRSEVYLGKYKDGTYCLFRIYTGFLDGSNFTEYFDENDNTIHPPRYYKQID